MGDPFSDQLSRQRIAFKDGPRGCGHELEGSVWPGNSWETGTSGEKTLVADIENFSVYAAKPIAYARDYRAECPKARPNDCIEMGAWRLVGE
jgi:hypothetical protein